jgi:hypothetical protein
MVGHWTGLDMEMDRGWQKDFFIWPFFYSFKMKFFQRYISDMLGGVACNSWLSQAKGSKG